MLALRRSSREHCLRPVLRSSRKRGWRAFKGRFFAGIFGQSGGVVNNRWTRGSTFRAFARASWQRHRLGVRERFLTDVCRWRAFGPKRDLDLRRGATGCSAVPSAAGASLAQRESECKQSFEIDLYHHQVVAPAWHPWVMQHPASSFLFNIAEVIQLMKDANVHIVSLDKCGFGAACRSTTNLVAVMWTLLTCRLFVAVGLDRCLPLQWQEA